MNIWNVTDGHLWQEEGFCVCVWAWGADEARRVAWSQFENQVDHADDIEACDAVGDCKISDDRLAEILTASIDPNRELWGEPPHVGPHEERRPEVLRQLGWRFVGEYECDCCGLCAMGMNEHYVCPECRTCRECAAEDPNREPCEACGR